MLPKESLLNFSKAKLIALSAVLLWSEFLLLGTKLPPVRADETREYRPDFQKVSYRRAVPSAIRHHVRQVGPTRFFGSFQKGNARYALHLYDTSRVRHCQAGSDGQCYERDSRLDVFLLTANKTWKQMQTFSLTRPVGEHRDKLTVEVDSLWLDPSRKTLPFMSLKIMGLDGTLTHVYGVLVDMPSPKAFISIDGFVPESNTTVTLSEISYPDVKGNLTLLSLVSDPGFTQVSAYGWSGDNWKGVGVSSFVNSFETARYWNGTQFIPNSDPK